MGRHRIRWWWNWWIYFYCLSTQPTGAPVNATLWFDPDVNDLAVYEVASDSGTQKWKKYLMYNM